MAQGKDYYAKSPEFGKRLYRLVKEFWNELNCECITGQLFQMAHLVAKRRLDFAEKRRENKNGKE